MGIRICNSLLPLLALASGLCSAAASKLPDRAQVFAKLPNWSGLWLLADWNLGVSGRLPGGEAQLREALQLIRRPPYNAEWMAKYESGLKDSTLVAAKNATLVACSRSYPALMESPWTFQVLVLPEETLILFENGQVRHIYTDGRVHPGGEDLWPMRLGDSIGRWEGERLVIDTIARDAREPVAPRAWSSMLSEQAHFTERLRLSDEETLEDQLSIEDPIALQRPWTMTLKYRRQKGVNRMLEYDCTENDRNPVVDGKIIITAP